MTSFYGDIIIAQIDPIVALTQIPASEVRAALEGLTIIAAQHGLGDVWQHAKPTGLSPVHQGTGRPRGRIGLSYDAACVAGIGFVRDTYLAPSVSVEDLQRLQSDIPRERLMAQWSVKKAAREHAVRGPEITAVQHLAATASTFTPWPLQAMVDLTASWEYTFEKAYQRRLAYTLAFEASLTAGTLEVYSRFFPTLIGGSLDELESLLPDTTSQEAFSIILNLLTTLDQIVSYERKYEQLYPKFGVFSQDYDAKSEILNKHLLQASDIRVKELTQDARTALMALRKECVLVKERGLYYRDGFILWGQEAGDWAYDDN